MSTSARLLLLSVLVAIGAVAAYVLLFRVAIIRNHPEGYVIAFALAALAVARRFGLVHERGGPDGQDGVVRWFSVSRNFQVRLDPGDVLRAVRAL